MFTELEAVPSQETECRILLNSAKSLIRAIRNRQRHPNGIDYVDMETDMLEETIVNLFGSEQRGPATPVTVATPSRRTPPTHSKRITSRNRRFAF